MDAVTMFFAGLDAILAIAGGAVIIYDGFVAPYLKRRRNSRKALQESTCHAQFRRDK